MVRLDKEQIDKMDRKYFESLQFWESVEAEWKRQYGETLALCRLMRHENWNEYTECRIRYLNGQRMELEFTNRRLVEVLPYLSGVDADIVSDIIRENTKLIRKLKDNIHYLGSKQEDGNWAEMIDRAREYPITSILEFKHGKALCPFHQDTHPSLATRNNLFKCFACEKGGDAIALWMAVNKVDFRTAVKQMNKER